MAGLVLCIAAAVSRRAPKESVGVFPLMTERMEMDDDEATMANGSDRLVEDYEKLCLEPEPRLYSVSAEEAIKNRFR